MDLENLMTQLTGDYELNGNLNTGVPGVYALPLEENLTITITEKSPGFYLQCSLGAYPKQPNEESFLTEMMLGNLFGQGTRGAVLGLSLDETTLVISRIIDYPILSYKEFKELIEDFINACDFWMSEITSQMTNK